MACCKSGTWQDKLGLTCLAVFCLLPFLVPLRTLPIPSFYAEWLALLLGVAALPTLLGHQGVLVPRIALLPLGLAALLLLQSLWLPSTATLIALLYLLWVFLLMLVTAAVLRTRTLSDLADCLAMALTIAALINALNMLGFQAGLRLDFEWLFLRTDRGGNLGQANMLADLLWVGIASVLYRWSRCERRHILWRLALVPLLLASALTGARAPMIYALWLILAALVFGDKRSVRAAIATTLFYYATVWAVHLLPIPVLAGSDSISRAIASAHFVAGGNIRLELMKVASVIALEHPLLGAGWGSFPWMSYSLATPELAQVAVGEHAHQLFFQLAAEMGVLAPLLVLLCLGLWAKGAWRQRISLPDHPEYLWAISAVGIVLLHAQLEYPLWYAHLLGVSAILLVCTEQRSYLLDRLRISAAVVSVVMVAGAYLLANSAYDYIRLQRWLYQDMQRQGQTAPEGHYQLMAELQKGSLLQAQAVRVLAAVMPPTGEQLEGKLEVCRRALHSEPQSPAVFTCALLEGLNGDDALAERDMRRAVLVFGDEVPAYLKQVKSTLSASELERHEALLGLMRSSLDKR